MLHSSYTAEVFSSPQQPKVPDSAQPARRIKSMADLASSFRGSFSQPAAATTSSGVVIATPVKKKQSQSQLLAVPSAAMARSILASPLGKKEMVPSSSPPLTMSSPFAQARSETRRDDMRNARKESVMLETPVKVARSVSAITTPVVVKEKVTQERNLGGGASIYDSLGWDDELDDL
jgi:hypothetical protein